MALRPPAPAHLSLIDGDGLHSCPHMLFTTDPLIGRHYVSIIEFQGETFSKRSGDRNYRLTAARTKAVRKAHVLIHLDTCTGVKKFLCTWFGEVCYSCSLTVLPGSAWVVLIYVLQRNFFTSVQGSLPFVCWVLRGLVLLNHVLQRIFFSSVIRR